MTMVSTASKKKITILTLLGSFIGLVVFWGFGFYYLVGSDGWPKDVAWSFDVLSAVCLLGLVVAILAVCSLVRERRQRLLAYCMILCGVMNMASSFWYLDRVNANSEKDVRQRVWFTTTVPCILWVCAALKWIHEISNFEDDSDVESTMEDILLEHAEEGDDSALASAQELHSA